MKGGRRQGWHGIVRISLYFRGYGYIEGFGTRCLWMGECLAGVKYR